MEELLKIKDAAEYLGYSVSTLKRFDQTGKLKPTEVNNSYRYYSKEDLDKFKKELDEECEKGCVFKDVSKVETEEEKENSTLSEDLDTLKKENEELKQRLEKATEVYHDLKKQVKFYRDKVEQLTDVNVGKLDDVFATFAMEVLQKMNKPEIYMAIGRRWIRMIRWNQPDKAIPDNYKDICVFLVQCAKDAWNLQLKNYREHNLPNQRVENLRKALEECFVEPHIPRNDENSKVPPSDAGVNTFEVEEEVGGNVQWVNTGGFEAICEKAGLWLRYTNKDRTAVEIVPISTQRTNQKKPNKVEDIGLKLSNIIAVDTEG